MSETNIETKRHSLSHVLAMAVMNEFPEAKLAIGPSIENGFYYDFDLAHPLTPEDLPKIEKRMCEILKKDLKFTKEELSVSAAKEKVKKSNQNYKLELIEDLEKEGAKEVSFYSLGDFEDLCAGPHVESVKDLQQSGFKLDRFSGAYWRGDEKNKMLQRIYGLAFDTKKELEEYLTLLEEAKKRDHRKLGQDLNLFSFHDSGPGFAFWHPRGMLLRNLITDYWRQKHVAAGYGEINTPIILREELWHRSGHWDNYKDNMYFTEIDEQDYAIKPMNCPGGIQVYKNALHSYRELPLRWGELGLVHRHELSGVLHGLMRVRAFTQDDAHIYCREDQIESELEKVITLAQEVYRDFGFTDYHVELSTRPEKSIGTDEMWKEAEAVMEKVATKMKLDLKINPGDGAFYGPKFDFHLKDSIGRTWQCATIQLDFSMPERFELEYVSEDGSRQRPVMIHRTILGSLERFIGVMIEHYSGAFPLWLSPVQVAVITVKEDVRDYAQKVVDSLLAEGIRAELHDQNESIGRKIRDAELNRIPYMVVVGDKEVAEQKLAVRSYKDKAITDYNTKEIIEKINKEIKEKGV